MTRSGLIAVAGVVLAVAVGIAILATGGGSGGSQAADDADDVAVGKGTKPPKTISFADLTSSAITRDGSDLVLEAEMASEIPKRSPEQAMSWRWELYEGGRMTWIVSANVDLGPNVSVLATQKNYSSSTVDGSLPGEITVDGSTVTIRLQSEEIEGFPESFEWLVKTSLDGSRIEPKSAVATDRLPEEGFLKLDD